MKKKSNIILSSLCAILIGFLVMTFHLYKQSQSDVAALQQQVANLNEQVKKAAVVKHISKQMEDIAYQQKDISDKRSDEAIQQSRIANDMRSRADLMRGKAELERVKAEESEKKAVEAYQEATRQRAFAEEKQIQAEPAKHIADTLSYRALARSLGSLSSTQYQIGNKDLAALLAYSSWSFATRYHGDVYLPAIFDALSKSSQSVFSKSENKGGITKIAYTHSNSSLITISKYGEIIQWYDALGEMKANMLFHDSKYDFRDLKIINDTIYALSRNGSLYVKSDKTATTKHLEGENMIGICDMNEKEMVFVAEHSLYYYAKNGMYLLKTVPLTAKVSTFGEKNGLCLLFCQDKKIYSADDNGRIRPIPLQLNAVATAYTWSPSLRESAIGTDHGTIYITDSNWQIKNSLTGHRSSITQVNIHDNTLLSSSYDCTVNLWNLHLKKIEPITLKTFPTWVLSINSSEKNMIWTGDESGRLSRIIISPFDMANRIHDNLTRDFNPDEWSFYVGNSIPFESYKKK